MDTHLLPEWESWPVIGIFNAHFEIQKWVNELHEDLAEDSVKSVFSLFSGLLNAAVRAPDAAGENWSACSRTNTTRSDEP